MKKLQDAFVFDDLLEKVIEKTQCNCKYLEVRVIERERLKVQFKKQQQDDVSLSKILGLGVRVLSNGTWGSSYTSNLMAPSIEKTIERATKIANISASHRKIEVRLADYSPVIGSFSAPIKDDIKNHSLEEKVDLVKDIDKQLLSHHQIHSTAVQYAEFDENKTIFNSDGAKVHLHDQKVEITMAAVAQVAGERESGSDDFCQTGGFEVLGSYDIANAVNNSVTMATTKLTASHPPGGPTTLIIDPSIVGTVTHEAVGHVVEADFVLAGAAAANKLGQQVATDIVTIIDDGTLFPSSAGWVVVDDEGVRKTATTLIENGILLNYLTNREAAAHLNIPATGNARAWTFTDEPQIRMTTTFVKPGDWSLDEMIADTRNGFLLKRTGGGQAEASADFVFDAEFVQEIKNGELGTIFRTTSITGNAFDVLMTVDAIGKDFRLEGGSGFCIKGQPIKVDSGGGSMRCKALLGGRKVC